MRGKDILGMADGFWSEYIVQEKCSPPEVTVDSFLMPDVIFLLQ